MNLLFVEAHQEHVRSTNNECIQTHTILRLDDGAVANDYYDDDDDDDDGDACC